MDQTEYYKKIYSKFWINQTRKYGYDLYSQNLVRLILKSGPRKAFEVGIGTGWPIGVALKEKKVEIDGCDIADYSVAIAKKELGNETGIWTGEVCEYEGNTLYDVTYCVRSSWYILDFYKTIKKMISMTKPGGYIVFDVMDKYSLYCLKIKWLCIKDKYYRFLGIDVEERYGINFISLFKLKRFLKKNRISYQYWGEREITNSKDKFNTPKVVFYCRKGDER